MRARHLWGRAGGASAWAMVVTSAPASVKESIFHGALRCFSKAPPYPGKLLPQVCARNALKSRQRRRERFGLPQCWQPLKSGSGFGKKDPLSGAGAALPLLTSLLPCTRLLCDPLGLVQIAVNTQSTNCAPGCSPPSRTFNNGQVLHYPSNSSASRSKFHSPGITRPRQEACTSHQ